MKHTAMWIGIVSFFLGLAAVGQQSSSAASVEGKAGKPTSSTSTIQGCLDGDRGNYIVIEDDTSMVFVLKGVGNKLDGMLHHQVEVKGHMLPNTMKTGVRPEKAGSNPSDTVHGIDGIPFEVANTQTDVRVVAKRCKRGE